MIRQKAGALVVPAFFACAALATSVALGPDASWDLRNYHLYDAFAALNKPDFLDLVPAQRQTFHPPAIDLAAYWLRVRLNGSPRLLDALLAIPEALAILLAWGIGRQVQDDDSRVGRVSLLLALLFGATGAAGLATLGTSMSEIPAACPALVGLLLLLRGIGRPASARVVMAGLLFGVSVGLKPTLATLAIAIVPAFAVSTPGSWRQRLGGTMRLGLGIGLGAVLAGGPWWLHMQHLTGSPLFPYMNGLFRSPLIAPTSLIDDRFLPHGTLQTLAYPFFWAVTPSRLVSELTVRDPRLAIAFLAALVCAAQAIRQRDRFGRRARLLLVFAIAAFALWEWQFSILRYLAPVELLSGLLVLVALRPLNRVRPILVTIILGALVLAAAAWTIYPDWGRASPATHAAEVVLPPLPADAIVLLLTADPMAYVAAFADPHIRFVALDNNLVSPGQPSQLALRIEQAVRGQSGPIFGLDVPAADGKAAKALAFYHLRRVEPCMAVVTNLEQDGIRLCRLTRSVSLP